MGLSCLAEFGRFIEIGKRDIYQNTRIPLWPLRRNASFHVVAMDAVFSGDEELARQLLEEIAEMIEQGALSPLPFRSFPACRIDAAFRLMAQGKHLGKVVVAFPESFVPRRGEPLPPAFCGQEQWLLLDYRSVRRLRQGAGAVAGRVRRQAPGLDESKRRRDTGRRSLCAKPSRAWRGSEYRAGGCRLG